MNINKKRNDEIQTIYQMIEIYCKGQKHQRFSNTLCPTCLELFEYAKFRINNCPKIESKTFCSNCSSPCYKPEKKENIRKVMKYAGPRMLFHHPILAIKHLVVTKTI